MKTPCGQRKTSLEATALPALYLTGWSKLRTAWEGVLEKLAPLGYEDETGFHFGVEPVAEGQ